MRRKVAGIVIALCGLNGFVFMLNYYGVKFGTWQYWIMIFSVFLMTEGRALLEYRRRGVKNE